MARTVEKILKEDESKVDLDDEIKDNTGANADEGAAAGAAEGPTPEEVAADLRKQLEEANANAAAERTRAQAAEAKAAKAASAGATALQGQITQAETAIVNKIAAAKTSLDSIKQQLKQAKSAGDTDAEVELQDAFTNARYELNAAEWEQKNFVNWKANQEAARKTTAPTTGESGSPYTAAEQAWIASHPEFNTSKKFARLAKIAAQEAKDEGHMQDSKAYFTYIEAALKEEGFLGDGAKDPTSGAAENSSSASTATPPNRSGGGSPPVINKNSKYPYVPKGFNIPKEWVNAASEQGFEGQDGILEYANERLKIEAEEKAR